MNLQPNLEDRQTGPDTGATMLGRKHAAPPLIEICRSHAHARKCSFSLFPLFYHLRFYHFVSMFFGLDPLAFQPGWGIHWDISNSKKHISGDIPGNRIQRQLFHMFYEQLTHE